MRGFFNEFSFWEKKEEKEVGQMSRFDEFAILTTSSVVFFVAGFYDLSGVLIILRRIDAKEKFTVYQFI